MLLFYKKILSCLQIIDEYHELPDAEQDFVRLAFSENELSLGKSFYVKIAGTKKQKQRLGMNGATSLTV